MQNSKGRKALASVLAVGVLGAVAAFGIFGAFSASTSNSGNEFSAATLSLSDNSHTEPVYFKTDALPGDSGANGHQCIAITYEGPTATAKLYGSNVGATGLESDVNLTITQGSGTEEDCSDFVEEEEGVMFNGTVASFASHADWASGLALGSMADEQTVTYKFDTELSDEADPEDAQGTNAGDQTFTWEVQAGS